MNAAIQKVPFWSTVGNAYLFVIVNFLDFLRLTWVLMVLTFAVNFVLYPEPQLQIQEASNLATAGIGFYALWGFNTLIAAIFIVAWHRLILLEEHGSSRWFHLALGKRELLILFIMILIAATQRFLSFTALDLLPAYFAIGFTLLLGASFLALLIAARLCTLYPRVALDKVISIKLCWRETRKNTFRILFGLVLCSVPSALMGKHLVSLMMTGPIFYYLLSATLGFLNYAIIVTFLSFCFKSLHKPE